MLTKIKWFVIAGVGAAMLGGLMLLGLLFYYAKNLPDLDALLNYNPKQITKLYAQDGTLLAEYARQRRVYVPIEEIPPALIQAFLAAEDTSFYNHPGFDLKGIVRAAITNILTNHRQGASTITQQVAKTFLLSSERTYVRKLKELILARRIEKALTKDEILELYLNQIYLGNGAYGVAAAALSYYGKAIDELSLGQRAMLAGLPRAPSAYNPVIYPRVARLRRDVILKRMETEGFVTPEEANAAIREDLGLNPRTPKEGEEAPAFSEHIRRELLDTFGVEGLYENGLQVTSTLFPDFQQKAKNAVRQGLRDYDRRHGYRGPYGRIALLGTWQARVDEIFQEQALIRDFAIPAAVLEINDERNFAKIGLPGGREGILPFETMTWARPYVSADALGAPVKKPSEVVRVGDLVFVKSLQELTKEYPAYKSKKGFYSLEQIPAAEAALIVLDIHTGAVRAMVGGFGHKVDFNRAVQAKRQPGSSFKPFVYSYALTQGYTAASQILDAPVVIRGEEQDWKPQNYSERVYGLSSLRRGLEKSRNLMTIRLAQDLGIRNVIRFSRKFGLKEDMPPNLSTALGAASASLLEMTSAYSAFPNGGKIVKPYFIEALQNSNGRQLPLENTRCEGCKGQAATPLLPPTVQPQEVREVLSPEVAYIMADLLRGVVKNGTGRRARAVGHAVGGKTGTTNDYVDAWFVGFSPLYAVGVWVGFDRPQTLGNTESGSKAALPIWVDFMKNALKGYREREYTIPEGITLMRIDADTGQKPTSTTKNTTLEVFVKGTEPSAQSSSPKGQQNLAPKFNGGGVDYQGIY